MIKIVPGKSYIDRDGIVWSDPVWVGDKPSTHFRGHHYPWRLTSQGGSAATFDEEGRHDVQRSSFDLVAEAPEQQPYDLERAMQALEFVARWAWYKDGSPLTRMEAIKYHPVILKLVGRDTPQYAPLSPRQEYDATR